MEQAALIAAVGARARELPGLRALMLAGSFGRGDADAVSDIDLVALADPIHHDALAAAWRSLLGALLPVVHWAERRRPFRLLNAIGEDWTRVDLTIDDPGAIQGRARDQLRALYDPNGLLAALPATASPPPADPSRIAAAIAEFIRILGLLPVIAARSEWVTGADGVGLLRRQFLTLMLEEVTVADRGGALHMGRLLPPERMALLASLPYPAPERDAVLTAHREAARAFWPFARAVAARHGVAWPEAFEAATRRRLAQTLALEV